MTPGSSPRPADGGRLPSFGAHVRRINRERGPVVQPRMGFADPAEMRRGLRATRDADGPTVGTITLDSYTRVADLGAVGRALRGGSPLNGYPLATHPVPTTRWVLDEVLGPDFPVQVRHGSARPGHIFAAMARVGLDVTEGGPVSYCLPYGRVPLRESVANWAACCEQLAAATPRPHLETFGGCMLGQLCPPALLVALSVLEAVFFCRHGVPGVSLSYAQQTHPDQDAEAVGALRRLAAEFVPCDDTHLVLYTYMGSFPRTAHGARALLEDSARLAVRTGVERIVVKTAAEAHRIPTIAENVAALEAASAAATAARRAGTDRAPDDSGIYEQARVLIERVLDLAADTDLDDALIRAFARGYLDVPYCLHPDNAGRTDTWLDRTGRLQWADTGALPIARLVGRVPARRTSSTALLASLHRVARSYDDSPPKIGVN